MTKESIKKWIMPAQLPEKQLRKYKKLGFDRFESQLLFVRNLTAEPEITEFFSEDLSGVPEFGKLHDAVGAAEKILKAADEGKKIFIHGDFDSDGICATSIVWDYLYRELAGVLERKVEALPYIPDRASEGYGLSPKSLSTILEQGADLIITVDCGIRDRKLIEKTMKENSGVDFVITDHHQPPSTFNPDELKYTIVHQCFPGNEYPEENVCGTFIAFMLVQALRAAVSSKQKKNNSKVNYESQLSFDTPGLDLVALATVTDIMPLNGINRLILKAGLRQINSGSRLGLKKLIQTAKVNLGEVDSYHLGYVIGPRINAAGRIGSAIDAVKLLVTQDEKTASLYSNKLNKLNFERQNLTQEILDTARSEIESEIQDTGSPMKALFVYGENWPEGIVGLVAGKLQEEFYRPTLVATVKGNEVRGSARSLKGFNITSAIEKFDKYLVKYGGHEQAAGFSVKAGKIEIFKAEILEYIEAHLDESVLQPELKIDAVMDTEELSLNLAHKIKKFAPFGYGNRKPMIMIPEVVIVAKQALGRKVDANGNPLHMKIKFKSGSFGISEAVMFGCADDFDKIAIDDVIDLAGYIGINEWNGYTNVQFQVKEWRKQ